VPCALPALLPHALQPCSEAALAAEQTSATHTSPLAMRRLSPPALSRSHQPAACSFTTADIKRVQDELSAGASMAALRRFNHALRRLPAAAWRAPLRAVLAEFCFNPAFAHVVLMVQVRSQHSTRAVIEYVHPCVTFPVTAHAVLVMHVRCKQLRCRFCCDSQLHAWREHTAIVQLVLRVHVSAQSTEPKQDHPRVGAGPCASIQSAQFFLFHLAIASRAHQSFVSSQCM
jgi:hypothetical protein